MSSTTTVAFFLTLVPITYYALFAHELQLSDPDVTRAVAFNIDWHYALDITDYSDTGMYVSERSLRNYRRMIIDEGLGRVRFPRTACKTPPTRLSGAPGQESLLLVLQGRLAPPCALTSLGTNPEIQEQIPMAVGHRRDQFPSQIGPGYSLSEKQSYAVHPDQFVFAVSSFKSLRNPNKTHEL